MRLCAGTLGLLLLAGVAASAVETGEPPLDKTKQELRDLQRDQAAKKSDAATVKLADPGLQIQSPTAETIPFDLAGKQQKEDLESQRRKQAQKRQNWLVDGVNQLEKSEQAKGRGDADGKQDNPGDDPDSLPDPSDPDYILKVYEQQKHEADTQARAKAKAHAASDPMAPFLQGWLGNTAGLADPLDSMAKRTSANNGASTANDSPGGNSAQSYGGVRDTTVVSRGIESPGPPPANPYLQNMETPVLPPAGVAQVPAVATSGMSPNSLMATPAGPLAEPPPLSPPAQKGFLPASPADEKKYFPQLKKF